MIQQTPGLEVPQRESGQANVDCDSLVRWVQSQTHRIVRDLRIKIRDGRLVMTGVSRSYYAKQLATHAVRAADATIDLDNEIAVLAN